MKSKASLMEREPDPELKIVKLNFYQTQFIF